jgi:hypothetical protein
LFGLLGYGGRNYYQKNTLNIQVNQGENRRNRASLKISRIDPILAEMVCI